MRDRLLDRTTQEKPKRLATCTAVDADTRVRCFGERPCARHAVGRNTITEEQALALLELDAL